MPTLTIYFGVLLVLAALVMGGLALNTLLQVVRLRNTRMSWRAGTLKGFPLFSTIFLGASVLLASALWMYAGGWYLVASGLYLAIASCWFVSSYFSSKRYITDHGIVKNVSDPAQTVAWHQIHDFVEREHTGGTEYVFIYREGREGELRQVIRLRLLVPAKNIPAFRRLISHKLGRHISCYEGAMIDVNEFN